MAGADIANIMCNEAAIQAAPRTGMAGADIANMCNEATIQSARCKADADAMVDFEKTSDRVIWGFETRTPSAASYPVTSP